MIGAKKDLEVNFPFPAKCTAKSMSKSDFNLPLRSGLLCLLILIAGCLLSCSAVRTSYNITKGTLRTTYTVGKYACKGTFGAGKLAYTIGDFTFNVALAPIDWPLTHPDISSIDGMPPKKAIEKGRVKRSPYTIRGRRYYPMTMEEASRYRQVGTASWYGYETYHQSGGRMTANGEAFHPSNLSAAHKLLPLPTHVRVTNLANNRSIIVRVNDRGPFVDGRIIDLSAGAAKRLGFYNQGTTRVVVETVQLEG
jgi:rare lipoprotein A